MVKNVGTQGSKGLVTRKTSVKYQICNIHYSKVIRKVKVSDRTKDRITDRQDKNNMPPNFPSWWHKIGFLTML